MSTNYERGRQYEYKSMRVLAAAGHEVSRTAGSHGPFDVLGISANGLILVQVKFNCRPTPAELEQFKLLPVPPNCQKLIHIWKYRARDPQVIAL